MTQKMLLASIEKENYANLEPAMKKIKLEKNILKYNSMDPSKKKELNETKAKKYKLMGLKQKEAHLKKIRENIKHNYQAMDRHKKEKQLEKHKKAKYLKIDPLLHDLDHYISRFHYKIKEGPYYICSVCNRYFQAVRPQFIFDALNWLKLNNPLYNHITIDINNISANLTSLEQDNSASSINFDENETKKVSDSINIALKKSMANL